jgi:hypothetical protein
VEQRMGAPALGQVRTRTVRIPPDHPANRPT